MRGRTPLIAPAALACALIVAGAAVLLVRSGDGERTDTSAARLPQVGSMSPAERPAPQAGDEIPEASRPLPQPERSVPIDPGAISVRVPRDDASDRVVEPPERPMDYFSIKHTLSQPVFDSVARTVHRIPAHDGIELYVEVIRPDPEIHGGGPWPVIMEASPYHGTLYNRDGARMLPDRDPQGRVLGLTGYFVPRGYAVVMLDLRGTGRSQGCLDHLGQNDAADIKQIVEWAADQEWSNGRVALTGHSYPGGATVVAISQRPRGLVTAVPSASLGSMYDHQFQWGVPYLLQYAGPIFAYEDLAMCRHLPRCATSRGGDNLGNDMEYFGCGWQNSAITAGYGQINGQSQAWHAERDHRRGAIDADIPIFITHGVNDNAARIPAAEWFFGNRFDRPGDKVWLGQWDHGSGVHPNYRNDQWRYALHAWFDKHLKQMRVETGPSVEAFLNRERVTTASSWSKPTEYLSLYPSGDGLHEGVTESGSRSFTPRPVGNTSRWLAFEMKPFERETIFMGLAELRLRTTLTSAQIMYLTARVLTRAPNGTETHMATCAIQPQLRNGIDRTTPVVPGQAMDLDLQCFTVAHQARAGDALVLTIGTTSPHHVPVPWPEAQVTVHTGPDASVLRLPVAVGARDYTDVPLDEKI